MAHLVAREEVAPGHLRLRLAWAEPASAPRLRAGEHLKIFAPNVQGVVEGEWNGRKDEESGTGLDISRRYTPVACDLDAGWYDLVVELITPERAPPDGGKFSRFAATHPLGEPVRALGPHGVFRYLGGDGFTRYGGETGPLEEVHASYVGIVAGGVASNTALNLVRAILQEPSAPRLWVVVTARTAATALHLAAFERLAADSAGRLQFWCVLEKGPVPPDWSYGTGGLAEALVAERLPPASEGTLLVSCGAPRVRQACEECAAQLGYDASRVWQWNEKLD